MLKKSLIAEMLLTFLSVFVVAEHYEEPIVECDEKFDKCAEMCGEEGYDACYDKCEAESNHCYRTYVYEDGTKPKKLEE